MALITPGAPISEIRGKVGEHVYSRNRGGAYVRSKGTLTDPDTPFQQFVRAELTAIVQAWKTLSPTKQYEWYLSALNFHYHNKLNKRILVSGYSHFISRMTIFAIFNTGAFTNLVVNGTFDNPQDWNVDPPWQISGGTLNALGGSPNLGSTTQDIIVEPSTPITVTFDITLNTISVGLVKSDIDPDSVFGDLAINWSSLAVGSHVRDRIVGANAGITKILDFGISEAITGNLSIDNVVIRLKVPEPPQPGEVVPIKTLSVAANNAAQSLVVTYSPTPTDSNMHYIIWGTPALSPGVNNPGSSWRIIGIREPGIASPDNIVFGYLARIGAIGAVGTKIFVSMQAVNLDSQQRALPVVASTIVT